MPNRINMNGTEYYFVKMDTVFGQRLGIYRKVGAKQNEWGCEISCTKTEALEYAV